MIEKIVYECIAAHTGGEKFFDALDAMVRNETALFPVLVNLAKGVAYKENKHNRFNPLFIVSGKFGDVFGEWAYLLGLDCLVLEGALRQNEIVVQSEYGFLIGGRICVFIDDSLFKGRTYDKVRNMVESFGGTAAGCVVAYDGGKEVRQDVVSLFRYYDWRGERNE